MWGEENKSWAVCWVAQWCWAALQWLVVLCWLVWCVLLLVLSLQHSGTVVEHYTAKLVQWGAAGHSSVLLYFSFQSVVCYTVLYSSAAATVVRSAPTHSGGWVVSWKILKRFFFFFSGCASWAGAMCLACNTAAQWLTQLAGWKKSCSFFFKIPL